MNPRYRALRRGLGGVFAALVLVLGLDAFWLEPASLRVQPYDLTVPGWTCPPIRIAVLADIHAGAPYIDRDKLRQIVSMTNAQRPDLIVLPGDFVNDVIGGSFIAPEDTAAILTQLRAPLGRYAVLGNHDRRFDPARMWRAFAAAGLPLIDNTTQRLEHQGCHFLLAGLDDIITGYPLSGSLARSFPPGEPAIAFSHSPDVHQQVSVRYALLIVGHTHGGQVKLPWFGPLIVPSTYGRTHPRGHYRDKIDVFVSSGIGTSILPVRFGVPPEISLLTVHAP